MPLISPPNRGYPDWGRVEDWDTPLLFQELNAGPFNAEHDSGVLDVSRFAYTSGWDQALNNPCVVVAQWLTAAAGGVSIATRQFVLSPLINTEAQYRLVNLGPYVQFQWIPAGAGAFNHSARLWATNRAHPLELIPQHPVIVTQQAVAIGAGASVDVFPGDYYAGPCQVDLAVSQQPNVLQVSYLDNTGTWQVFASYNGTTTNDVVRTVITPAGAWKMTVINQAGGAGLFWLRVTPSPTGSS